VSTARLAVRRVTAEDVSRLSDVLARAFDEDPPMRWFLPDSDQRIRRARLLFEVMLRRLHLIRDVCFTTD
jgi:hypothetical protein